MSIKPGEMLIFKKLENGRVRISAPDSDLSFTATEEEIRKALEKWSAIDAGEKENVSQ